MIQSFHYIIYHYVRFGKLYDEYYSILPVHFIIVCPNAHPRRRRHILEQKKTKVMFKKCEVG